jgi:hypothetical protein
MEGLLGDGALVRELGLWGVSLEGVSYLTLSLLPVPHEVSSFALS